MTRNVENLRAINGGKTVEVEYLGCLLWSTVSDVLKIPTEDLKTALNDLCLEKFMPRKINPRDAFRRVTKAFEFKREPYGRGTYTNLLVRDVKYAEGEVIRQLVREVVDGQNKRLDYMPVLQLEIGADGDLGITPLVDPLTPSERVVKDTLPQAQEEACNHYDGTHIRYMLQIILKQCDPVSVRPNGGVEFIPQKHITTVESVKELCKRLNQYQGHVRMYSIPVIDAAEHREMIEENLEEQVINGSVSLIQEMKNAMENPAQTVSPRTAKGFADRIKALKDLVSEYEEMLETQSTKARANLDIARQQAIKLMELASEVDDGNQ